MRVLVLALLGLAAAAPSAQTLPQFSDYPAGPVYRGRAAPLVLSSSPNARTFRTRTREAMAEGVNFAGHYVVAMWGCGTECMGGQIVDARTGRVVSGLPSGTPYVAFQPDSRLFAVNLPAEVLERYPADVPLTEIASYGQSEFWLLEGDSLRFVGALLASDLEAVRLGGPMPALRTAAPGDVLVPLAVGNAWTYATAGGTVTLRVTGPDPDVYSTGVLVERVTRDGSGERRAVEVWGGGYSTGDGSLFISTAGGAYRGFGYAFGVPLDGGVERETVRIGSESHEALCYAHTPDEYDDTDALPSRACFVPRLGMVSDDRDGAMTLTSYTLR